MLFEAVRANYPLRYQKNRGLIPRPHRSYPIGYTRNREDQPLESQIVDIRHFDGREFSSLLQAESRVWGKDLHWDYTSSAKLISTCIDEKRLSGYALVNGRSIEGYTFFFYEGEKGLIGDLFVPPESGGLAQAVILIEHVIETLLATPGLHRIEAQLPHFTFEALHACFRSHGFECYLRRFMAIPLSRRNSVMPSDGSGNDNHSGEESVPETRDRDGPAALSDSFAIEPWERKYDRRAAELLFSAYRHHVDASINDQYNSLEGTNRLIENIVRHRGCGEYLSAYSRVAVYKPTRQLAGILALTAVRPMTAHIPQIAVAREFQGRGVGRALMEGAFQGLAAKGYREVSLTVTDLNSGAVRLYERLGFETFRTFGAFVWHR